MTATVQAEPAFRTHAPSSRRRLLLDESIEHNSSVVHVTGELDLATRNQLVSAVTAGNHPNTMIDLGGVTFMDCSGYRALVAARRFIEAEGRRLTITGQTGQPARLLAMVAELQECPLRPTLRHPTASPHHRSSSSSRDNSVAVQVAASNSDHKSMEAMYVHHGV